jgi:uncharacterized protein (UPF0333 family)
MHDAFPPNDDTLKTTSVTNTHVADNSSENLSMGWLLPLLLLVLAAGLFFYFRNSSVNSATAVASQFVIPSADTAVNKKPPVLPDSTKR